MNVFQLVAIPLCILLAGVAAFRQRKVSGRTRGILFFWPLLWFIAAVLIAMPQISSFVAARLGIGRGADLILYVGVLAGMGVVRYFYQRQRRMEILLTELIRSESLRASQRGPQGGGAGATERGKM